MQRNASSSQEGKYESAGQSIALQASKGKFLKCGFLFAVCAVLAQVMIIFGVDSVALFGGSSNGSDKALKDTEWLLQAPENLREAFPQTGKQADGESETKLNIDEQRQRSATDAGKTESTKESPHKPLNILFLYADDWRYNTLGVENPIIQTPVLDQLAKEGVRFTHNCVTTSICWVSRATLFSGQYMTRHGTRVPQFYHAPENETIWSLLQDEGGYYTGHVGKLGIWKPHFAKPYITKYYHTEENWHLRNISGKEWHITEHNEYQSLEFLENRPRDKPFFLHVGFYATHAVDGSKEQYMPQHASKLKYYVNDTIQYPVTGSQESRDKLPSFITERNEGRRRFKKRYNQDIIMPNGENQYQYMMKNLYRMATEVDTSCGRIIDKLKEQGELDNTLIIFTADNGVFHAEHGLADKWYPHEESIRVPLIIKDPRMKPEMIGTTNDDFTLNIDLAPTLLSAARVQALPDMMGRDMSVLYRDEETVSVPRQRKTKRSARALSNEKAHMPVSQFPWREEFFYEHPVLGDIHYIPSSEALVRKHWKYFYWPDFKTEQLFDLRNDPIEDNDLIKSNTTLHKEVLTEMRTRFLELKRKVHSNDTITF